MEALSLPWYSVVMNYAIFGFFIGFVCGAIPLFFGATKGKLKLGFTGLICCAISGAILNIFLAIPVAGIFIWQISKKGKANESSTESIEPLQKTDVV